MSDYKAEININKGTVKTKSGKGKSDGNAAFAGGFIGSLLGDLLSSVKSLFEPLSAIANMLVLALFPLLKPFLILFLKVGLLLFKWLNSAIGGLTGDGPATTTSTDDAGNMITEAGTGLSGALWAAGTVLVGTILAIGTGLSVGWIAALSVLGGIIISKAGTIFVDMFLSMVNWIDEAFGTNFIEPISGILDGFVMVFQGLYDIFAGLISLDFGQVWEGLKKSLNGLWEIMKNTFILSFDSLKFLLEKSFEVLADFGTWIYDGLVTIFTTSFDALTGIGTWIWDKVTGFFSFGGGSDTSVNDAIITPNGDIIRTNPNDYLIATKNPESLGNGGSGGQTINVNINGGLITEDVAIDIGRILQRELNLGGGF